MRYLKLFESFDKDMIDYIFEFWEVDPNDLWELFQDEIEDNSLKEIMFTLENNYNRVAYFFKFDGSLSTIDTTKEEMIKYFPLFKRVSESIINNICTELHFEFEEKGVEMKLVPLIELRFERGTFSDGRLGEWEDNFNAILDSRNVPYQFDSEKSFETGGKLTFNLYHN